MPDRAPLETKIEVNKLAVWYGSQQALRGVTFDVASKTTTALIGAGGSGKTTLLRALNRMHDLNPDVRVQGSIKIDGAEILGHGVDTARLRRNVGMVFAQATMLPTSIGDNVMFGLAAQGIREERAMRDAAEKALRRAGLWEKMADRLDEPAAGLSDVERQRVCIARALAVDPDVLLFDDPTALMDPIAALAIEDVIARLRRDHTLIIATNDLQQAARLADITVYMANGEIVESGDTPLIFNKPGDVRTEAFLAGRTP
ncbi:MAG: phosphate ABC transporter ATP-binding protein [Candidatus Eremiobacteraeota bacterium]|nr:phosphate ABC transporter ATP-binding protein [Candidatus Eremiobacteraeota bacterium]MBV8366714.1 phosphate ABC transporter ATP-binding protein [Candidatus Eremiobacteraeota bacterium]